MSSALAAARSALGSLDNQSTLVAVSDALGSHVVECSQEAAFHVDARRRVEHRRNDRIE
jgi:hypothetical protein